MDKKADWNDHQDLDAAGGPWAVVASWCCTAGDMGGYRRHVWVPPTTRVVAPA